MRKMHGQTTLKINPTLQKFRFIISVKLFEEISIVLQIIVSFITCNTKGVGRSSAQYTILVSLVIHEYTSDKVKEYLIK